MRGIGGSEYWQTRRKGREDLAIGNFCYTAAEVTRNATPALRRLWLATTSIHLLTCAIAFGVTTKQNNGGSATCPLCFVNEYWFSSAGSSDPIAKTLASSLSPFAICWGRVGDDRFQFVERETDREFWRERIIGRSENAETESSEAQTRWDFAAAAWDGLESSSSEMGSSASALSQFQLFQVPNFGNCLIETHYFLI